MNKSESFGINNPEAFFASKSKIATKNESRYKDESIKLFL